MTRFSTRHVALAALAIATALAALLEGSVRVQAQGSMHQPNVVATKSVEYPFGFKAYRNMITERNYLPVVALKDAIDARATDAVGAVSGLRGEISVIEGRLIVSYGADCAAACPSTANETATLLATAAVRNWRPIQIAKDLDAKATETFIREQAKAVGLDESKPFPFRINGVIVNFVMHINAAPNPRFKGHGSFDEMAITGLAKGPRLAGSVIGFYAPPPLQGVITHMAISSIHTTSMSRKQRRHTSTALALPPARR
jgi:acetolactate decarboxylase